MTGAVPGSEDGPPDLPVDLPRLSCVYPDVPLAWVVAMSDVGRGSATAERAAPASLGGEAGWSVLHAAVGDYLTGRRRATATAGVEVLLGVEAVRARLVEESRRWDICLALGGPESPEAIAVSLPYDLAALDRGQRDVTLYPSDSLRRVTTSSYLDALGRHGAAVRVTDVVPLTMKICIGQRGGLAVLPLDPADPRRGCVIVHDATRVRPLRALFDRYWSAGRAIGTGAPADEVAGRRAAIIELMAEGLTDPAIAVHLGISLRTVTRQVKALMQETRSVSRFQLGYALARHSAEEQ